MPRPKKSATNGAAPGKVTKADLIREAIRALPKPVRQRDVIAKVKADHGATVTSPQVSKILQRLGLKRKGRRGRPKAGGVSKAERIRQLAGEMGGSFRPRDIVAQMAKEGRPVTSAQVSNVLSKSGYRPKGRKGRRGRRGHRRGIGTAAPAVRSNQPLDVEALVAAKALIEKIGGLDRVEAAIGVLKKLQ